MKLTGLDASEIPRYTYDDKNQSSRVTIVAGDLEGITDSIKAGLKDLKIDIAPQEKSQAIEIPVIIKEVQIVEVPTIVKEIEIKEIEKQVLVQQEVLKVIEIEKPVVVKEFEKIEVPVITVQKEVQIVYVDKLNVKLLYIMQAITLGLIVLSKFL